MKVHRWEDLKRKKLSPEAVARVERASKVREGWAEAFRQMHERGEDDLLLPDGDTSTFDDEEWQGGDWEP